MTPNQTVSPTLPRTEVLSRFTDFWLLGGASVVLWLVMVIGQFFRDRSESVDNHFLQVSAVFSLFSLFVNNPHFMISYRFGYSRGSKFIFKNWFSLLALPLGMIAYFTYCYFHFTVESSQLEWIKSVNSLLGHTGLTFRLGTLSSLGIEMLSFSVLMMNLTVGWHYSKQIFGCMIVYSHYDKYPLSYIQRNWLKASLFSVAFFNFFYLSNYAEKNGVGTAGKAYFFNIPLVPLGLPYFLVPLSALCVVILFFGAAYGIFFRNWKKLGLLPSQNLLIPWIAFHVWWIPVIRQTEFYFAAIPFFHSLQYLPFAYRMECNSIPKNKWYHFNFSMRVALLLLVGFCAFELFPSLLDRSLETSWYLKTWFFVVAFVVFLNIHHFFIDSVVWKMNQPKVKKGLLTSS